MALPAISAPIIWIDDGNGVIGRVDVGSGNVTILGSSGTFLTDLAADSAGNLWSVSFGRLYRLNNTTGASTFIGNLGNVGFVNSLVFGPNGTLYAASDRLFTIDTTTGAATAVGSIGFHSGGDLAFVNGELFMVSTLSQLVRVNTATGAGTLVGSIGVTNLFGLASTGSGSLLGTADTSIYHIDLLSGAATFLMDYGGSGLSGAFGASIYVAPGNNNLDILTPPGSTDVPEPATAVSLIAGLGVLLAFARRLRS